MECRVRITVKSVVASSGYVLPVKLPWRHIVNDLHEKGFSYEAIAFSIGLSQSTLQNIYAGHSKGYLVEPSHSIGEAILILHSKYCGRRQTAYRLALITT